MVVSLIWIKPHLRDLSHGGVRGCPHSAHRLLGQGLAVQVLEVAHIAQNHLEGRCSTGTVKVPADAGPQHRFGGTPLQSGDAQHWLITDLQLAQLSIILPASFK